jgi:6-phosphogluconolactonase
MPSLRQLRFRAILLAASTLAAWNSSAADYFLYVGTYTSGASKGIYVSRYQPDKGKTTTPILAADTGNPSFLAVHPNHEWLYAVNENGSETVMGSVSGYSIDHKTGKLTPLNWVSSKGGAPCHLALDGTAKWLAVANYTSGSVAILPISGDGRLGDATSVVQQAGSSVNKDRQSGPHAHEVVFSPDNNYLLVPDLGADKIFVYRFDAVRGVIAANDPPFVATKPGVGPRHLVFHPNGKMVYVVNELASSVTAFHYDAGTGKLEELQSVSALPEGFTGANTAAEIAINIDGTRLYTSNRGHDSIALFSIDPVAFTLTAMEMPPAMVQKPRHFTLDPDGRALVVAGQDSGTLAEFRVHPHTGQLQPLGRLIQVANPVCVLFVPVR